MGRRSNAANSVANDIKSQVRRPRKPREVRVIPLGFIAGQLVSITNDRDFKGEEFGIVFEACKHDGGIVVRLSDDGSIAKYTCIRPELGDTIERLNQPDHEDRGNQTV